MPPRALLDSAMRDARAVAHDAARRSPAYRTLLAECGLHTPLHAGVPWTALPVLDKANTFGRFSLHELAGKLHTAELADVLTSSGRGGSTFGLRLGNRRAHDRAWFDIDLGLQDAFDVDHVPTLVVNCLPMGVVFPSRAATVATVSVREDMACAVLAQLGPAFGQTIVCTDPLFINRLLDHAADVGLDWSALNTSFVLGEEMLVAAQREHIAARVGIAPDAPGRRMVASSFGVGELGLNLLFDTRETIALGQAMARAPETAAHLLGVDAGSALPALMCFNPLRCHVEVLDPNAAGDGNLCITLLDRHAVIPLPRYATGDTARLVDTALAQRLCAAFGLAPPWLPMVALHGRASDRLAGWPAVEDIKQRLYGPPGLPSELTGAFRLQKNPTGQVLLLLQLKTALHEAAALALHARLLETLSALRPQSMLVQLVHGDAFPGRPCIDYERKFRYLQP